MYKSKKHKQIGKQLEKQINRQIDKRQKQQGFVFIELLVGILIGSIVLISLFSTMQLMVRSYESIEQVQRVRMELETIRQFIIEECQISEEVCIYGSPLDEQGKVMTGFPFDLMHASHNTQVTHVPQEGIYEVSSMVFNANVVNANGLSRANKLTKAEDKLIYQKNRLAQHVTKWQVIKEGEAFYMTIGITLEDGREEAITYLLPINYKEERDEAWKSTV